MKRIIYNFALILSVISFLSSCKKSLENDYLNPQSVVNGSIDKVFSSILLNRRIQPTYWDFRTFILPATGAFSQLTATETASNMWIPSLDYGQDRWTDFYSADPGIINEYTEMNTLYNALSDEDKSQQYIFLELGKVILYDQASQMIDLWGDIPFSASNSLNTSDRVVHKAAFDDAATLYNSFIDSLDNINTYLSSFSPSTITGAALGKQDLIYSGDLTKWKKYANSLRLRLLMRISNVSEDVAKGKITTMLNDGSTYPLIESNTDNALLAMSPTTYNSDILEAFRDNSGQYSFAPTYLLDSFMNINNDPRLPFYWNKASSGTDSGKYVGMPIAAGSGVYNTGVGQYSTYDSATFMYNYNVPGVLFTASESEFLKAEAYQRWNIGDPSSLYEAGIRASINFYYGIQSNAVFNARTFTKDAAPTEAAISSYLAADDIKLSGTATEKLEKIYKQKWEHFFILQAGQAWAEVRRTGYPKLTFYTATNSNAAKPPMRLLYPSTEKLYNSNYSSVQAKDTRDTKIFWDIN